MPSLRRPMPLHQTLTALFLIAAMSVYTFAQNTNLQTKSVEQSAPATPTLLAKPTVAITLGETVADIGNSCWYVFQDKDNNYWFGSDGLGVCRYDGKTLTRFTTKDGLAHDQVRGIQQHASTGDILITTNDGVSKFDGQRFVTLPITEMNPPGIPFTPESVDHPHAIAHEGWVLNTDELWLTGAGGPRRYDGKTLYQLKFPKSPLEKELSARLGHHDNWSPYDVWTVYKDSRGHMWFGTGMFGICRFDGQSHDWMFEPHLAEVEGGGWFGFRSIIEDRNGDFWFCNTQFRYKVEPHGAAGQEAGKLKYLRREGMDLAGSATTDTFLYYQSITEDNNGDLWMAPYAGGVWKYDGKNVTHYPMKFGDDEITMFTIYKDNHGDLWVGTHKHGAYKFNGKTFERFAPPVEPGGRIIEQRKNDPYFTTTGARTTSYMPKVIIRNILQDRAGNIWFATFGGPIRYDGKEFTNFAEEVGLATTRIFSLLEDRAGTLWFGSITGGATRYDGQTFAKFTEKEGLAGTDVFWIFEDRDANIWLGTNNGVSRYDGKTMTNFTTKDGLIDNSVYTIGQDAAGRLWFGTQGGICSYDGKSFSNFADQVERSFANIRSMIVDRSGNIWFGGPEGAFRYDGKTLTTFTSQNGLLDDFVGSMIVDKAGNIWFGHPGGLGEGSGGASRFDGTSFKQFTPKDGLGSASVYCMFEDKAGDIWFGSVDAGACRYDGKSFTHFSATAPELGTNGTAER